MDSAAASFGGDTLAQCRKQVVSEQTRHRQDRRQIREAFLVSSRPRLRPAVQYDSYSTLRQSSIWFVVKHLFDYCHAYHLLIVLRFLLQVTYTRQLKDGWRIKLRTVGTKTLWRSTYRTPFELGGRRVTCTMTRKP